jgi:predicted Rossmann fold flavoprotein
MFDLVIIGGGPGGIFAALQAKNKNCKANILILEKTSTPLAKVKVSGGGRCNITNATFDLKELCLNYPRGSKELISAFHQFQPNDMINWLKDHGIFIKIDENKRVFPSTDSSQTIIDCFLKEIKNKNIEIKYNQNVLKILKKEKSFEIFLQTDSIETKNLIIATGSSKQGLEYAKMLGHSFEEFIPSLFSFKTEKHPIAKLSGLSQNDVEVSIKNTCFSYRGSILITHEGFSGPAIINLSSFATKYLFEKNYKTTLMINWLYNFSKEELLKILLDLQKNNSNKNLFNLNPFNFPKKLWEYFLKNFQNILNEPIQNISKKSFLSLIEKLYFDEYSIISKSENKSEFVSCGGINLKEINFKDMQSKLCKNLYFVGELLNIDGITGGYNLQNAWTTGYIAGNSVFK